MVTARARGRLPTSDNQEALGHAIVTATDQKGRLLRPIGEMATWELRKLRSELEEKLGMETLPPYVRPREQLQADLDAVIKEQQERAIADRRERLRAQQADA